MDSELEDRGRLTASESQDSNNGREQSQPRPENYAEVLDRLCPIYMSWGMSWEQFWHGDCEAAKHFRKAAKLRERQRDYELWLQGLYVREAVLASIGNAYLEKGKEPFTYPDEPYSFSAKPDGKPITEEELEDRKHKKEDGKFMAYMAEWMSAVNKSMAEKQKLQAEGSESNAEGSGENTGN